MIADSSTLCSLYAHGHAGIAVDPWVCSGVGRCLVLGQSWEDRNRMINRWGATVEVLDNAIRTWSLSHRCSTVINPWSQRGEELHTVWMKSLETMSFHPERSELLTQQDSVITVVLETIINVNLFKGPVQTLFRPCVHHCCGLYFLFLLLNDFFLKVLVALMISGLYCKCVINFLNDRHHILVRWYHYVFIHQKFLYFKNHSTIPGEWEHQRSSGVFLAGVIVILHLPSSQSYR